MAGDALGMAEVEVGALDQVRGVDLGESTASEAREIDRLVGMLHP
jgi:hypothetical protein